jgi:ATP-binding cassette subfamily F protein 3
MINLINLSKYFGSRVLLDQVNLQLSPGERLGLVGRNGHGKSTLFKLILGEEVIDEGQISIPKNYHIGHLAQHLNFTQPTILKEACLGLDASEEDQHYKAEAILFGLGFSKQDMLRAPSEFSGGFQIRLNLAKILVSQPNLLLLDEPTNYLDIVSIRWLISFLRKWKNELILITHDRNFMDRVTTHTAIIHRQKIKKIQGDTQKLFSQIAMEEEVYEKTRVNDEKKRKEIEEFVNRFRAKASKATMVQSRVKMLENMPDHEKLAQIATLGFDFSYAPTQAKEILKAEGLNFSYEQQKPIIQNFSITIKHGEKIAIIGKNGKGKSTLMNLLAQNLQPQNGAINCHSSLKSGIFAQTNISTLSPKLTIEEEIMSANPDLAKTAVRSICATMMFTKDDATKKISVLSGGEKSRVLLGKILAKTSNCLFLDEPTNHLDMDSIDALMESLQRFPGTVIIVTHSEEILRTLPSKFIIFQNNTQEVFSGTYDDFLEKIGWEEEAKSPNDLDNSNISIKAQNHQRNEILKEKNKVLNNLKKEIEKLEIQIMGLENNLTKMNVELITKIELQDNLGISQLSKDIAQVQKNIDLYFQNLENVTQEYNNSEVKYDTQIKNLFSN